MVRPQQLLALGLLIVAVALAAGCGTTRTETAEAEPRPGAEGPGVVPNQNRTGGTFLWGLFGDDDEAQPAKEEVVEGGLSGRVTRLEETLRSRGDGEGRLSVAPAAARPGPAIGVLFGDPVLTPAEQAAYRVMERLGGPYPLTVVGPARIREALERYGCPAEAALGCSAALAVTPGIRLLARVEGLSNIEGDSVTAEITLIDTELELRHPPIQLRLPVTEDGRIPEQTLAALADAVFLNALERLRLTPPIYHVVASRDGRWLLNRGRDSGLAVGDVLSVHDGGTLVRGPSGAPAAWMPGPVTGRLRVEGFAGEAAAIARLVDGSPPRPADPLTPALLPTIR